MLDFLKCRAKQTKFKKHRASYMRDYRKQGKGKKTTLESAKGKTRKPITPCASTDPSKGCTQRARSQGSAQIWQMCRACSLRANGKQTPAQEQRAWDMKCRRNQEKIRKGWSCVSEIFEGQETIKECVVSSEETPAPKESVSDGSLLQFPPTQKECAESGKEIVAAELCAIDVWTKKMSLGSAKDKMRKTRMLCASTDPSKLPPGMCSAARTDAAGNKEYS